jgi:hypothetical protein
MIYFLRVLGAAPVKIGTTRTLKWRQRAIQSACPYPLVLIRELPGDSRLERRLHLHFAHLRIHGEWYSFADEMMTIDPSGLPAQTVPPLKASLDQALAAMDLPLFTARTGTTLDEMRAWSRIPAYMVGSFSYYSGLPREKLRPDLYGAA